MPLYIMLLWGILRNKRAASDSCNIFFKMGGCYFISQNALELHYDVIGTLENREREKQNSGGASRQLAVVVGVGPRKCSIPLNWFPGKQLLLPL